MALFFSSDHHFGHANIIRYCERPFDSAEAMDKELIERWNAVVSRDDTVFYLGDFTFSGLSRLPSLTRALNGRKLIIPGNHDPLSSLRSQRTRRRATAVYRACGWQILREAEVIDLGNICGGDSLDLVACHYPPFEEIHGDVDEFCHLRPKTQLPVVHGHTHQKDKGRGNLVHIGVDSWDFTPVLASTVLAELLSRKS